MLVPTATVGLFGVTWTYNALPFLVTNGVSSALSRRVADYILM